ncbi:FecCD family ABC transporter permease [Halodurantibacterium flavum]|uniref:FecCD family ABC transporter permease n=1 Tax=Halodurantibacterium flavum TaxID=1382802 RepID=A0ABW4S4H2_9RHOB
MTITGIRGLAALAVILLLAMLAGVALGDVPLGPGAIWQGLTGGGGPAEMFVRILRGPRVVTGALAGAALGLSGAILQSLLRNPLAAPDVLGFTSGAGLGVAVTLTFLGGAALSVTLGAAMGGILAALLVGALAAGGGGLVPLRLILVGIGAAITLQAGTEFLLIRANGQQAAEISRWLSGSLAARNWGHAAQIALCLGLLVPLLLWLAPALRLLELGDDLAAGLGTRVAAARAGLAALAVLMAAAAVAVAGPVPFVALLSAPVARRLGGQGGAALAGAALVGAAVTVLADLAARIAVPGVQLPLGVMTGLLGAPYLLWLLTREMERGSI